MLWTPLNGGKVSLEEIAGLEPEPVAKKRGSYKKKEISN
jgi:hypothetical protein